MQQHSPSEWKVDAHGYAPEMMGGAAGRIMFEPDQISMGGGDYGSPVEEDGSSWGGRYK